MYIVFCIGNNSYTKLQKCVSLDSLMQAFADCLHAIAFRLLLLSFAFMISSFVSAASWRPHPVLSHVVLRSHRRSKSTGTHSQYASWFVYHHSCKVATRCNPSHACCCGIVPHLFGTCLTGSFGHGSGPFPVAGSSTIWLCHRVRQSW